MAFKYFATPRYLCYLFLMIFLLNGSEANAQKKRIIKIIDNLIEATMDQKYEHSLTSNKGDFVLTSTRFKFTGDGLYFSAGPERFQRAVLMRAACGDRWSASFRLKWTGGRNLGAGMYFAYENMVTNYYVGVNGREIYLMRNGEKIYKVRFQAQKNKWLSFRIKRSRNSFKVWVDGIQRLNYEEKMAPMDENTSRNPLPYGGFALGNDGDSGQNTKFYFRDLVIAGNTAKKPLKHAYVEKIKLKKGMKNVIIWLHKMDDRAPKRAITMARAIQVMEKISGLSYPTEMSAEATSVDYKAENPFTRFGQAFFPDLNTLLSNDKSQDFLSVIAAQWAYFQELWLAGGFPLFISGVALQELGGKPFIFKTVPAFKRALNKMNDPTFTDVSLNGVYLGPEDVLLDVLKGKEFYAEKGALFLFMVYRDLGEKQFAQTAAQAVANLAGKRYVRSKRINSEDFLLATTEIAKTNYKPYFNGWIFQGKYSRWSPKFFVDKDQDGLLLMEEKIIGTDDNKTDTDGDGYSDTWEYLNGFDPKDKKKPNVARIAVDGFITDWANFGQVASILDPANDVTTSFNPFDVRKVMMRSDDKFLYIGVQYHNDIRLNKRINHRFNFRFEGDTFHRGTIDLEEEDFIAQRLKGNELWYDYFAFDKGFRAEFGLDMEIRIPLDFFDNAKRIELSYSGPGAGKGKEIRLDADTTQPIEIFLLREKGKVKYLPLIDFQRHLWGFGVEELKSSADHGENLVFKALDLRKESYWEGPHPGDWIMLKLDRMAKAKNLVLTLDKSARNKIKVETSRDGSSWRTVVSDKEYDSPRQKRVIPLQEMEQFKEEFRYIRIHLLKSSRGSQVRIYEVGFEK